MPDQDIHRPGHAPEDGDIIARVHPAVYTLIFGCISVLVAGLAFIASLDFIAYFDLPLNFLLFIMCGTICLGAGEERPEAVPGVVIAAVGVLASCLHLLVMNDHPWLS